MKNRLIGGGLFVVFGVIGFSSLVVNAETQNDKVVTELLVEYEEGYRSFSNDQIVSGVKERENITAQVELWTISEEADMDSIQRKLMEDKSVSRVEPNYAYKLYTNTVMSDPYLDEQWWIPHIQPYSIWSNVNQQQKDVVIAVIDSGIDTNHEDLRGRIQSGGYNFNDNNTNVTDLEGHGTQVAGVIAATAGNSIGITGVTGPYNMKILPIKVFDSTGYTTTAKLIQAVDHAVRNNVDVINLSLGGPNNSSIFNDSVQRAITAGISVVASSGNEAMKGNPISYPASYPNVISVGAIDNYDERTNFSNYNDYVSIVAPGLYILTTSNYNSYKKVSGTSFSSPMVAGAAAIIKSQRPKSTPSQIKQLLEETATDLGPIGRDKYYGTGALNLENLNTSLVDSKPAIPVRSITLNTDVLTIDLDKKINAAIVSSPDLRDLEQNHIQADINYERERNDTFTTANPLTLGTGMFGSITDNYYDIDYYSFNVNSSGRFSLLAGWLDSEYVDHRDNQYLRVGIYNSQKVLIGVAQLDRLTDGTEAMYYSGQLEKGNYYLAAFQDSPYKYLFLDEQYIISTLFTPNQVIEPEPIPVFSFNEAFMSIGQYQSFVKNLEATAKLTSTDSQVATVSSDGVVRAISRGATTIRYNSATTSKEAKVKVSGTNSTASVALFENILPINATNQSVTWSSSNSAVAEVDEYGIVTGKKAGTTVVSIITTDGNLVAKTTVSVIGGVVQPEFKSDFPEKTVNSAKVFTITFNQNLQVDKDYSKDILISRDPNGINRLTNFIARVDPSAPKKLLVMPTTNWNEGKHYLTIKKTLQNENLIPLNKDVRMKFDVIQRRSASKESRNYMRILEEVR
ncbi:S8 family serine peptidase [Sporosarcina ureae]|uniref:S8 family serine peptidase n=1 Tax=Sporosarcina ureae TaxID=1571 RepID=UPI0026F2D66B|nr:S8 family serine peptidase [Sporosarcina ureae]